MEGKMLILSGSGIREAKPDDRVVKGFHFRDGKLRIISGKLGNPEDREEEEDAQPQTQIHKASSHASRPESPLDSSQPEPSFSEQIPAQESSLASRKPQDTITQTSTAGDYVSANIQGASSSHTGEKQQSNTFYVNTKTDVSANSPIETTTRPKPDEIDAAIEEQRAIAEASQIPKEDLRERKQDVSPKPSFLERLRGRIRQRWSASPPANVEPISPSPAAAPEPREEESTPVSAREQPLQTASSEAPTATVAPTVPPSAPAETLQSDSNLGIVAAALKPEEAGINQSLASEPPRTTDETTPTPPPPAGIPTDKPAATIDTEPLSEAVNATLPNTTDTINSARKVDSFEQVIGKYQQLAGPLRRLHEAATGFNAVDPNNEASRYLADIKVADAANHLADEIYSNRIGPDANLLETLRAQLSEENFRIFEQTIGERLENGNITIPKDVRRRWKRYFKEEASKLPDWLFLKEPEEKPAEGPEPKITDGITEEQTPTEAPVAMTSDQIDQEKHPAAQPELPPLPPTRADGVSPQPPPAASSILQEPESRFNEALTPVDTSAPAELPTTDTQVSSATSPISPEEGAAKEPIATEAAAPAPVDKPAVGKMEEIHQAIPGLELSREANNILFEIKRDLGIYGHDRMRIYMQPETYERYLLEKQIKELSPEDQEIIIKVLDIIAGEKAEVKEPPLALPDWLFLKEPETVSQPPAVDEEKSPSPPPKAKEVLEKLRAQLRDTLPPVDTTTPVEPPAFIQNRPPAPKININETPVEAEVAKSDLPPVIIEEKISKAEPGEIERGYRERYQESLMPSQQALTTIQEENAKLQQQLEAERSEEEKRQAQKIPTTALRETVETATATSPIQEPPIPPQPIASEPQENIVKATAEEITKRYHEEYQREKAVSDEALKEIQRQNAEIATAQATQLPKPPPAPPKEAKSGFLQRLFGGGGKKITVQPATAIEATAAIPVQNQPTSGFLNRPISRRDVIKLGAAAAVGIASGTATVKAAEAVAKYLEQPTMVLENDIQLAPATSTPPQTASATAASTQTPTPTATATKPAPSPTKTSTSTPSPIPSPTETPPPTAKSKPIETKDTLEQEASTATPEAEKPPKNIFKELVLPKLKEFVEKRRLEKQQKDPEYLSRINPELNKDRINFLLMGIGKENALTDSILVGSYHEPSHTLSLISLPRDLQSPEVLKKTGNPASSRINQAFAYGGMDLAGQAIENATGLSVDFTVVNKFDALIDLVDKTTGYVDIELDEAIDDPKYPAMEGYGYDYFQIGTGQHRVDGKTALKIARSRQGSKGGDYDRAGRQQKVFEALLNTWANEGKRNVLTGINLVGKIKGVIEQKLANKSLQLDFAIDQVLWPQIQQVVNAAPMILIDKLKGQKWEFGEKPQTSSLVISNKNFVASADIPGVAITKIKGGNPYAANVREGYWKPVRQTVEQMLMHSSVKIEQLSQDVSERILSPQELSYDETKEYLGRLQSTHDSVLSESLFTQELASLPKPEREKVMQALARAHARAAIEQYGDSEAIIGLDPGHGQTDIGSSGKTPEGETLVEKDITWQLAQMTAQEIYKQSNGEYYVVILRPEVPSDNDINHDGTISPVERLQKRKALLIKTEEELRNDPSTRGKKIAYISLHFNAHSDPKIRGTEVYWPNKVGEPDASHRDSSMALAQRLQRTILEELKQVGFMPYDRGAKEDPDQGDATRSSHPVGPYVVLGGKMGKDWDLTKR